MKKFFLTVICLAAAYAAVEAQEISDKAAYTLNIDRALWYGSGNAAGLARTEASPWRNATAAYGLQSGTFTNSWEARSQTDFGVSGSTLLDLNGFKLAAAVCFDRESLRKAMYNNSLFDLSWDMPFFVAVSSPETFRWGRTSAGMDLQVASPLLFGDMLSLGMGLRADFKHAAKHSDPRSRFNGLELEISPSATVALSDENTLGVSLRYILSPSQSRLYTRGDDAVSVALMQGLGYYSPRWVGGSIGLEMLGYNGNAFGAGLQYNRKGSYADWLISAGILKGSTSVVADKVALGSVDKILTELSADGLMGDSRNRRLSLGLKYDLNYWLNGATSPSTVGRGHQIDAKLDYTVYTGASEDHGFDWLLGGGLYFDMMNLKRYTPDASLGVIRVMPNVFLGKDTAITAESSLLVRMDLGYNFSAKARYKYQGDISESDYIVNHMFDDETDYLGAYWLRSALEATYTYHLNSMLAPYAGLKAVLVSPMGQKKSRFAAGLSVGVFF